jgi:hypothetical protein
MAKQNHFNRYLQTQGITYQQYLASEHWQDVRRRYWACKLHDRTCFACHKGDRPLEVHHKTYKRMGAERLHDLCLLCRDCHQSTHDYVKKTLKETGRSKLFGAAKHIKKVLEFGERKWQKRRRTWTPCNEPGHHCHKHCKARGADGHPCQSPRVKDTTFCVAHQK